MVFLFVFITFKCSFVFHIKKIYEDFIEDGECDNTKAACTIICGWQENDAKLKADRKQK